MHEKKRTLKPCVLYITIQNICFLFILFIALAMHLTYLLCLNISHARFGSTYHMRIFPLYNTCVFCECINSGLSLSDNNFTLSKQKRGYRMLFFNGARAHHWKYSQYTISIILFVVQVHH